MYLRRALLAGGVLMACGLTASADQIGTFGLIQIGWGDGEVWQSDRSTLGEITQFGDGAYQVEGTYSQGEWVAEWLLDVGGAAGVSSNVSVTSTVASTETFDFTVFINSPVAFDGPTQLDGSVSVNVSDNVLQGAPGATVSAPQGGASYRAIIGDNVVGTLLDDPFSLMAGAAQTNSAGPHSFSDSNGPALALGDAVAIRHEFQLTGFDIAQFAGTFTIVPEPATAAILLVGVGSLLRRRR